MAEVQLYVYNQEEVSVSDHSVSEVVDKINVKEFSSDHLYWLNFHSINDKELIERFFDNQHFHRLTLEDVYTEKHRPKLEEFEHYIFFSIQSALPKNENPNLEVEQISFILGKNFLISFQEHQGDHFTDVRKRIEEKIGKIREKGGDFLMFRLLDAIIDNYFEVLDEIMEVNRQMEARVIRDNSSSFLFRIEVQKRKLTELRKFVLPMRDIAVQLEKIRNPLIEQENMPYFSDLKDNCLSILDDVETHRQILEGLSNLFFAHQGQRMNEIMKVLTIVSTFFIPMTFIVGVYGMNFKFMPELESKYGYPLVWLAMILSAIGLGYFFHRKGWIRFRRK